MADATTVDEERPIRSLIPARMHDLPWSRFHWMVILGLGTAWILDGLEIQIVAAGGFADPLKLSTDAFGAPATVYLLGEVAGALLFGRLTDRLGRKKMFTLTLALYLVASGAAGLAPNALIFLILRFIAGMGIGGEYSAVNSAIDELIPGRYRGRVDLAINGTYWFGAAIGAVASYYLLDPNIIDASIGWRLAFFIGPILGLGIIVLRRHIPESPRWLVTHGHPEAAEQIVDEIEAGIRAQGNEVPEHPESDGRWIKAREGLTAKQLLYVFFKIYPTRTVLGATLMITQSFLYNAIFFTYTQVLQHSYNVSESDAALYMIPFAIGNLLGPLLLGPLFDTIGRRRMIAGCYSISGIILGISAPLYLGGHLNPVTHTLFWCASFFFASAGASAAYLTVSEIFPQEVRGQAISYFFCIAQVFGSLGPLLYGILMPTTSKAADRVPMFWGYLLATGIMLLGAAVAAAFGVDAEGKSLEEVAPPLTEYDENGHELTKLPV